MKKPVIIIGAGGHGKVALDILLASKIAVKGFVDDGKPAGTRINGYPVLGPIASLKKGMVAVLGIGDNGLRSDFYHRYHALGVLFEPAVHPRAVVSKFAHLEDGVVVMPGAVVNANAVLGTGVVINTGATVDHDCHLKSFCQIWPGAHLAGSVEVGELSYIGMGACVVQNKKIGDRAVIGAGAVVIADVPDDVTAVGVPARITQKK